MDTSKFVEFFDCCVGSWATERTYHYLTHNEVERSRTEFTITPLTSDLKAKVMSDNQYALLSNLENLPGFSLGFYTISEKGEEVSQQLNLLFVPKQEVDAFLEGDYLRDRAYEEAKPIISHFRFDSQTRELLMTTHYTRVVSVDSITLVNPSLRIRKIINYQRPPEGQPLEQVALVGFGVEQKVS
ncbi:phycobiliprotein lyase [Hydrococcus rivularis NIES-593]|uniref:Chromophore lyase CpcS/CpeS n=1 Tax=Hydrococcus rivularis NIES-593 TaxID=1921803 RepID=A0A1U7HRN5_9CYAN|nr:phycobiliprotein lyase [Hydrococcus rivularis]OKH26208.1 phycobiliprotein lyase [Hydrococcus rivularis NIES-593]